MKAFLDKHPFAIVGIVAAGVVLVCVILSAIILWAISTPSRWGALAGVVTLLAFGACCWKMCREK